MSTQNQLNYSLFTANNLCPIVCSFQTCYWVSCSLLYNKGRAKLILQDKSYFKLPVEQQQK